MSPGLGIGLGLPLIATIGGGGVALPAGNADLIASIVGGDSSVLHFADVRTKVAHSAGFVDVLGDCRGSGFGLDLTESGAARPAWVGGDDTAKLITFNGSTQWLLTAASVKYTLATAKALIFIGAVQANGNNSTPAAINDGTSARYLEVQQEFGGTARLQVKATGNISAISPVVTSTTRRVIIGSKNGATDLSVQVPNTAKVTNGGLSSSPVGDNILYVGFGPNGGLFALGSLRALLVLDHEPNADEVTALMTYGSTYHAAVAA